MYIPLPDSVTIKKSDIHGLGLFTTHALQEGINLGVAHVQLIGFPQDYCRTPLGGFYNHSDDSNCELRDDNFGYFYVKNLFTIKDIAEGEELTCTYTLYSL